MFLIHGGTQRYKPATNPAKREGDMLTDLSLSAADRTCVSKLAVSQRNQTTRFLILGPTQYALDLREVLEDIQGVRVEGFIECEDRERCEIQHGGLPVHWFEDLDSMTGTHVATCALGTTHRSQYISKVASRGMRFATAVHPSARVSSSTTVGEGSMIDVGCIVAGHSTLGHHVRLKRGSLLGHHTRLGDFVSVQPGANIAGRCRIGQATYIGMSAVVLDGIKVGSHCVLGAGAVVTKDVPDRVQVVGVPARIVKENISGK